jgi:hypothetical protein
MKTLTHEQETFVRAYARIVAASPDDVVRLYFEMDDDDAFYKSHPYDYASVTDAYLMWDAALSYAKELA